MTNEHATFNVGIVDQEAAGAIRLALMSMNGVIEVMVDLDSKRVAVEFDAERIELDTLKGSIEDAGFKVR